MHDVKNEVSVTGSRASFELELLRKNEPCAVILEFEKEILALVDKFGNSGQSGGSAPYVAAAISGAVESLCMHDPIGPITGCDTEWGKESISESEFYLQNKRLGSVFKDDGGRAYFLDAIVFKDQDGACFTGSASFEGKKIYSRQYIKAFPFNKKTFYIEVVSTEWADKNETVEKEGGGWWASEIKDWDQVKKALEYYDEYAAE